MSSLIRRFDWSATPLGVARDWPASLRAIVNLVLEAPLPMIVLWGPDLIQIYNDPYSVVMGTKHPWGLGRPTSECWPEVWDFNQRQYAAVMDGATVSYDRQHLTLERSGEQEPTWFDLTYSPARGDDGEVAGVLVTTVEVTERVKAEAALRSTEERFRTLVEGMPQLVWRACDGGHWTWASPQWTAFTGQSEPECHGHGWLEPVHPDDRDGAMELWGTAIERGSFEGDYRLLDARDRRYRWFQTRAMAVRDERGEIVEWLGTSTDVDDLRAMQERQAVLVAELQHRTLNLIGVVRSLAGSLLGSSRSLDEFGERFDDRVGALARAQRLLSRRADRERVTVDELVRTELEASGMLGDPRVVVDGPPGIGLRSRAVQTFAMALHELATNALKYGALRQPNARLDIRWRVNVDDGRAEPALRLDWRETGVAMPDADTAPGGTGQGRTLIEHALPYQLKARTTYELGRDGVKCSIVAPVLQ